MENTAKQNGEVKNRLPDQVPVAVANQQLLVQQNMQQTIANMQQMTSAMSVANNVLGSTLDMIEPLQGFAQLEGQHFEMHEVITFSTQD